MKYFILFVLGISLMSQSACSESNPEANNVKKPVVIPENSQSIIIAGGCFWCVEGVFEQLEGVLIAESGYSGGKKDTADYATVSSGGSDHAEAVAITYDPTKISLEQLFDVFFKTHDPTQLNGQGNDIGRQYRSAIFYADEQQKSAATAYIKKLNDKKYYSKPIVTTLEELDVFYSAEKYHQDYVRLNPNQGYVRAVALPKIRKACTLFPDLIKKK